MCIDHCKSPYANHSGGIRTHDLCIARADVLPLYHCLAWWLEAIWILCFSRFKRLHNIHVYFLLISNISKTHCFCILQGKCEPNKPSNNTPFCFSNVTFNLWTLLAGHCLEWRGGGIVHIQKRCFDFFWFEACCSFNSRINI